MLGRSSGVGNGNPVQYFYLENFTDRGAWRTTVHGVVTSPTRLSTHTHIPKSSWRLFSVLTGWAVGSLQWGLVGPSPPRSWAYETILGIHGDIMPRSHILHAFSSCQIYRMRRAKREAEKKKSSNAGEFPP